MADPQDLLAWMRTRPGDVTMRSIGEDGPRAFRRAADNSPALAALIAAGSVVEVSARPRTFRVAGAAEASAKPSSGSRLLDMLADAAAELDDVPDGLRAYWSAVSVRDDLVARMRAQAGFTAECECCAAAAERVDEAVIAAFGCEMMDA